MKKASSLFILFLLLMGCQREFPPAPDHSTRSVSLTENWKFNMPDGERAIWIDAGEDDVLYLTVSTDKVCTYLFSYDGELLKKQAFTHSRLVSYLEENSAKRRNNNWLSTSYLSHSVFLNYETGESHIVLEDEELVKDSSFNYYLFKDDVCYYNKVDEQKNYQLIQWNLKTGGKQVLDTLITATYLTDRLSVLGSYRKPMGNIDANLLYLSRGFERFNDVYAFNLLGYATDNFFGNKKWESPVLFRNDDPFYKGKVVFNDAVCYFNISKTKIIFDFI
mgnify:CR=1 FL=1